MEKIKKGFIPVMLTPFRANGEIDFKALTSITEWYIASGASGLFANCLSSEMFNLSDAERIELMRHVVLVADGAVPVVAAGTFGGTIASQADFIKRSYDTGIKASIIISSQLAESADADTVFEDNVFKLMELTESVPLGFYECPEPYKRVLSAKQLKMFVESGRVLYHKDTCLDIDLVREKLEAGSGNGFELYDAYMVHAIESLKAGAAGLSCIQGNFFPELIVWFCENYDKPEMKNEVDEVFLFLKNNMVVMHDVYPVVAKYFLQKRGMDISMFSRKNAGTFSPEVKGRIDGLYVDYQSVASIVGLRM
jgi:4-hydroxy-tetrahydrodipicolinate synthase